MKQSRATVVDYLPTLMPSYQQLFIRNPAEAFDWEAYTLPLSRNGWMAVGVFFLILPLIMVVTFYDCKFGYRWSLIKYFCPCVRFVYSYISIDLWIYCLLQGMNMNMMTILWVIPIALFIDLFWRWVWAIHQKIYENELHYSLYCLEEWLLIIFGKRCWFLTFHHPKHLFHLIPFKAFSATRIRRYFFLNFPIRY